MRKETLGTLLVLTTAIISGFAIPINKLFVVKMEPLVFTAVRALVIGLVFFLLTTFHNLRFSNEISFRKIPWKYMLPIGLIGGGLAFFLYFTGLKLTTAGRAAFIHKTLPLYVTVLAFIFLKERITRKQLVALGLMFFGTVLLVSAKINPAELWLNPSLGDLLAIIATICWAVENVISRKAMLQGSTNFSVACARMFIGSLFLFSGIIILGKTDALLSLTEAQVISILISTAILFGYVFTWYWGIKLINVSKASTILLLSPVISLILGALWFGEPVPQIQILGSALILGGAYLVTRVESRFVTGV